MLTCVDGVSLRQNSRQDSPWGGKSPFGQRLGENHRNPPAARNRDSCAVCGATASGFPPERKAGFPALADGHSPSVSPAGAGTVRPTAGNRRFFDNPGEDRNTVPTLQGKPGT